MATQAGRQAGRVSKWAMVSWGDPLVLHPLNYRNP